MHLIIGNTTHTTMCAWFFFFCDIVESIYNLDFAVKCDFDKVLWDSL